MKEEKETWAEGPDTWVFSTKMPLRDLEGNIVGTFGISRDITERKRFEEELLKAKEKAEASDRLKTVFMRNISHEIRTPLNGILGFGQLMSEPNLSQEEKEEFLIMVNESSDRLMNTVTNIMENSLIVSGNQEVQKKEIILDTLLDEIYNKFSNRCEQKRLTFLIQKQKNIEELIIDTDAELLNKVLHHLIDNAIKYTTKGFVAVGYNLMEKQVLFYVKDSGIGISQDQQQLIFDHFIQGDDSYTRDQEGNGLGLSIAKGLVELLGGRIWVESVRGEGSSFFFTIPTEISGTLKSDIQPVSENVRIKPLVLIADDEETNSLLLERMLRKEGLEMLVVSDGQQCVETCKNNPLISMVLMDLKMPVLDGFEATKMIKAFRPDLPIIALSAFALSGDERKALAAGCNEYMTKPLRKDLVMRKLRQYGVVD
jgi:signal transduction histidine kinase